MPTKPLESVLYRELAVVEAKHLIDIASPLLKEIVNFSTNALIRCGSSSSNGENEDLAILYLYKHIVEMTDGIEVLISQSCVTPSIPLLRSSFEALISIEYIVETEENYLKRSLSWLVEYIYERIHYYESLDASTIRGQNVRQSLKEDSFLSEIEIDSVIPAMFVTPRIDNLNNLLAKEQFKEILEGFKVMKGKKAWYRLFKGPSDIRNLAKRVGRSAQYDFFYKHWSQVSHAHEFSSFILSSALNDVGIRPLRDKSEFATVASNARSILLGATHAIVKKFRPEESLSDWYKKEVITLSKKLREIE